jgi:hypothetical protein
MTVLLFNGEDGIDKRQVVVHIVPSKLPFPSKVSLAFVTFVTTLLLLLLLDHLQITLDCY